VEALQFNAPSTLAATKLSLERLAAITVEVAADLHAVAGAETNRWASALAAQCRGALDDLTLLTSATSVDMFAEGIPSLRELSCASSAAAIQRIADIDG